MTLHPRVRALYKQLVVLGRQHPTRPFHLPHPTKAADGDAAAPLGSADAAAPGSSGAPCVRGFADEVKAHFRRNAAVVPESDDFKRCLAWGRFGTRELEALIHIHKFRAMKRRYDWETFAAPDEINADFELRLGEIRGRIQQDNSPPASAAGGGEGVARASLCE